MRRLVRPLLLFTTALVGSGCATCFDVACRPVCDPIVHAVCDPIIGAACTTCLDAVDPCGVLTVVPMRRAAQDRTMRVELAPARASVVWPQRY